MEEVRPYKLPASIPTFADIRTGHYIYVDKTEYLVRMIDSDKTWFMSRPRRFGKSLTCSTFEAMFTGRKELFRGLYAEEFINRSDYHTSPVIRLDMSALTMSEGIDGMKKSLKLQLLQQAKNNGVVIDKSNAPPDMFSELMQKANDKSGQAVVLLDEYDKPYSDQFNNPEYAEQIRRTLREFYVRIKAQDAALRFIFITGISKFVKFGVFSGLNNPIDISLDENYGEMLGMTQEEIIRYFPEQLEATALKMGITVSALLEKMRYYYDGFCFDGIHRLYNPYSTVNFFVQKDFRNYWMKSGGSQLIADYLKTRHLTVEQFRNISATKDFVDEPGDMDTTSPEGFLYQGGYLSIKAIEDNEFTLDYPNTEVLNSMSRLLAMNMLNGQDVFGNLQRMALRALKEKDVERIVEALNCLLSSIPYDDYKQTVMDVKKYNGLKISVGEYLYRSTILSFLRGCSVTAVAEMHTDKGRPDLVVSYKGNIYVIEMKVAEKPEEVSSKLKQAIAQMRDGNYLGAYPGATGLALVIDDTKRQITQSETVV